MQPRFERRSGSGPASLVEQPRFRAAFDFLRLRSDVDEVPSELAEWWEDYSLGSDEEREALMAAVRPQPGARRVKSPRAPSTSDGAAAGRAGRSGSARQTRAQTPGPHEELAPGGEPLDGEDPVGDAPRKRRRRRRRSGGGAGGGAGDGAS
ncbi:MAG: hypothetical protein ACKOCU_11605 [Betaproteobacteria bacterium]